MKKIKWRNPNQILIETGHKTFDKQTNIISTGNIIANTIYGNYIRPYTKTSNGYEDKPEGYLMNWDLQHFKYIPNNLKTKLSTVWKNDKHILYEVFHYNGNKRIVHGIILTKGRDNNYDYVLMHCYTGRNKSYDILFEVRKYISNMKEN